MAWATETDQFTTPRTHLYDIGPSLSRRIVEIIESDRTGETPEQILSRHTGRSIIKSRLTRWVRRIQSDEEPVLFRPAAFGSIYPKVFSPVPGSLFFFYAPTVHVHGHYMGTDKIDHFFRQGYDYLEIVKQRESAGATRAEAIAAAVAHGVKQEHGYFGTLASGIYSNADLAANYAGMKFYLNLRNEVIIGDQTLPALFEHTAEGWRLRRGVDPDRLIAPYLSDHFDESLNPSRYLFNRGSIRARVRGRCAEWKLFYADRLNLVAKSGESFGGTWFGESYGHWLPVAEEVSIATECTAEGPHRRQNSKRSFPTGKNGV